MAHLREQLTRKVRRCKQQIKSLLLFHGLDEPPGLKDWTKGALANLRALALQAELFDSLRDDGVQGDVGPGGAWSKHSEPYGGALMRLARYETMLERSTTRLLGELWRVQAARQRREGELLPPPPLAEEAGWRDGSLRPSDVLPDAPTGRLAGLGLSTDSPLNRGHGTGDGQNGAGSRVAAFSPDWGTDWSRDGP